ncbi:MAG: hypothetical protein ACOX6H_02155 [Christensenellales bacterium]|jgi:hypothetical protein
MKKLLNLILAIMGFVFLTFIVLLRINAIHPFIQIPLQYLDIIGYVVSYGATSILALWVLVYFSGKGVIRVLLTILIILLIALGVIAFGFPDLIIKVLG